MPPTDAPATALPIHRDPHLRRLLAVGWIAALIRWLEILAFGVVTFEQTGSAFWVASMTMLRVLPMGVLGVPFGALAARISRRRGLLVTQGTLLASALVLLAVSARGALQVWHLALASLINGLAWTGDNPLRRGLIGDIAGSARLARAMGLDALANSACRLAGPAAGGVLLASGGLEAVFAVTALLYAAAFAALRGVREPQWPPAASTAPRRAVLAGGLQALRASPRLAATLWITIVFNVFGWPALSMVPVIGQERLALDARGIGLLASMDGVGSLAGALMILLLARTAWHGWLYAGGVVLYLALVPVFALAAAPLVAGAALLAVGLAQSGFSMMQATLVYASAPPQRRLEAMGLLTMCIGLGPIGFLTLGGLAGRVGAPAAVVACAAAGLLCLVASWRFWRVCLQPPETPAPITVS